MTRIPLLIIGATFAGIGVASAARRDAWVVEQASQPGSEFVGSYRIGQHWDRPFRTPEGKRFLQELRQRNIVSGDCRVHLPAVLPVLCRTILAERLHLLLQTAVADIADHPDGYEVTLFHASGMQTIVAERIVDTSSPSSPQTNTRASERRHEAERHSPGAVRQAAWPVTRKSINAMLHRPGPAAPLPPSFDESVSFAQGRFDSEVVLQVSLEPHDDWIAARQKLHRLWSGRPEAMRAWSIAAVADTFETHTGKGPFNLRPNWSRLPSCAYANLVEAFEAGLLFDYRKGAEDEISAVGP